MGRSTCEVSTKGRVRVRVQARERTEWPHASASSTGASSPSGASSATAAGLSSEGGGLGSGSGLWLGSGLSSEAAGTCLVRPRLPHDQPRLCQSDRGCRVACVASEQLKGGARSSLGTRGGGKGLHGSDPRPEGVAGWARGGGMGEPRVCGDPREERYCHRPEVPQARGRRLQARKWCCRGAAGGLQGGILQGRPPQGSTSPTSVRTRAAPPPWA